jgi:hypothetical protein
MNFQSSHKMTLATVLPLAFLLALNSRGAPTATAPAVAGSVADDSGNPVAGARVFIDAAPPAAAAQFAAPPVITGKQVAMVASGSSGAFSVRNLPPGQYIACAEAPTQGLLDPCLWASSAPTFTVTTGQSTTAVNVVLARGAILPIHIDDPMALLTPAAGPVDFKLQVHIVTSKGLHYMARIQSSTAGSRNLAMTIPFGTPVTVLVQSANLIVNNSQPGAPAAALGMSVTVPAGTSAATINYVVAGQN